MELEKSDFVLKAKMQSHQFKIKIYVGSLHSLNGYIHDCRKNCEYSVVLVTVSIAGFVLKHPFRLPIKFLRCEKYPRKK